MSKEIFALMDDLLQLSFVLQAELAEVASVHELSIIQVRLLGILRDREPSMLALAGHLKLEKSSLSGLVDRAEARGLVQRVPSADDGRSSTVRVTALGRKLTRAIEEAAALRVEALVGVLTPQDRRRLAALLRQLLARTGELDR